MSTTESATATGTYTIDPTHSRIGFVARHAMVTKVRGSFTEFSGSGSFDEENPANSQLQLTIQAKRSDLSTTTPLVTEYRPRDYFRSFSVPRGIDASKIAAQLTAGVLRLHLPKSESIKPRRIEVKQG